MNVAILIFGVLVTLVGLADLLSSAFGTGGGFLARRVVRRLWPVVVRIGEITDSGANAPRIAGLGVNVVLLIIWVVLISTGWALVFASAPHAVISQTDYQPADAIGRVQFTASTLSGLGRGVWQTGGGPGWTVLVIVASLTGTFVISFAISFLIPIIQAAAQRRALGHRIALLGGSPLEIASRLCNEEGIEGYEDELKSIQQRLIDCVEQHATYPTLHYLPSSRHLDAFALNLVMLDEALRLVRMVMPDFESRVPRVVVTLDAIIERFLDELDAGYVLGARDEDPGPDIPFATIASRLDCPVDGDRYGALRQQDDERERRRILGKVLRNNGWTWAAVYRETGDPPSR